jgi:hypothetical protein
MTPQPIPYPADTKAKGWRFELDLEQIKQSDTWDLAAEVPMAQHALLMMWTTAWQQVPCGSMPADRILVRAKLKIPPKLWEPMAEVVLRGWWLAEDGRLYHDTIVSRVRDMLSRKSDERQRKADYRARMEAERLAQASGGVPQMSHGTDKGQQQDGHGKDDTGTGTGTGTGFSSSLRSEEVKPARVPRKPPADASPLTLTVSDLISEGVKENHAREWFEVRKKHKAPLTQTAWNQHKAECLKAGITPGQGVQICAAATWRGFDHTWNWRKHLPAGELATTPVQSKFGGCDAVEPA